MRSPCHVITEFLLLIKIPPFNEVNSFNRKWQAHGEISKKHSRPLFTIIFRPEMLKFHAYSILTRQTMVRFVIYCVLKSHNFLHSKLIDWKNLFDHPDQGHSITIDWMPFWRCIYVFLNVYKTIVTSYEARKWTKLCKNPGG